MQSWSEGGFDSHTTTKLISMTKVIENNIAEIIMIILLVIALSSCGTTQYNVGTGQKMSRHCSGAWVNN